MKNAPQGKGNPPLQQIAFGDAQLLGEAADEIDVQEARARHDAHLERKDGRLERAGRFENEANNYRQVAAAVRRVREFLQHREAAGAAQAPQTPSNTD